MCFCVEFVLQCEIGVGEKMIGKANFHTHTTFCDGKELAEDMVLAAMKKGFTALGFSGHSYTHFDKRYCMSKTGMGEYRDEVWRLKQLYADKISIYCGIEQDFYSSEPSSDFEYAIGSVHYIKKEGQFLLVDEMPEIMKKDILEQFGGDPYAYAKVYFETVKQILQKTNADIIGHFDLITKFNEDNTIFDTTKKRYKDYGIEAIEALIPYDKPFEINTGAIYRGFRKEVYPSVDFLKEIKNRGGNILFSSDSHDGESLGFGFHEAEKLAFELGFQSRLVWTPKGFEEVGLSRNQ